MNVLLVEDSDEKASSVEAIVREVASSISIARADSLSEAVRISTDGNFDLVILDLMIPYIKGITPESEAGYEFMRQFRRGIRNRHTKVIAISAFPEEVSVYRDKFDSMAVIITKYDESGLWKDALREVTTELIAKEDKVDPLDFIVICALDEERDGYDCTQIEITSNCTIQGLNMRMVSVSGAKGAIIRTSQMGLVTATHETALALRLFDPKILAMSGICAGIAGKVQMGQLICAGLAWEYQAGKWSTDGFEIAPLQVPIPAATRAVLDHMFDEADFAEDVDRIAAGSGARPSLVRKPAIGPMASGSAVIANSKRLDHIIVQHRKITAIDMETFGVYYSAHHCVGKLKHFFSIKSVVDMADKNKGDDIHGYGSRASAIATVRAIGRLLSEA